MRLKQLAARAVLPTIALLGIAFGVHRTIVAADHFDPPARVGGSEATRGNLDVAADIADVYAFHDNNNLYLSLSFGGPSSPSLPAFYDRDVLYAINVSNEGSRTDTEFPIQFRFGFDGASPGIQVTGLPPNGGTITGPVETNLTAANGIVVRAGLFDDPFFFDPQGLRESRQTGNLSFNNQRNPFANRNTTFVVISIPRALVDRGQPIDVWSTASRIRG